MNTFVFMHNKIKISFFIVYEMLKMLIEVTAVQPIQQHYKGSHLISFAIKLKLNFKQPSLALGISGNWFLT